jgi:prevent-host-death family protein
MRVLPLAEAKAKLSEVIADVEATDEEVTITRNGRAAAVLVSCEEFERWRETVDIMSDPEFLASLRRGIRDIEQKRFHAVSVGGLDEVFSGAKPARRRRQR